MDSVFPDVSRAVHILGRQAVGIHRVFGPAGEVVFHIAEVHIGAFRDHLKRFEQGIQENPPVLADGPGIRDFLEEMAFPDQFLLLQVGFVLIHLMVGAVEHVLHRAVLARPVC